MDDWRESALCAQTDPELFFPDKGGNIQAAVRVCHSCPVILECLEDALGLHAMDDLWGVRGGLSYKQRGRIRARRNGQHLREAS